jgi:1-acyl-sn-glycerol-3-phosphate acyltransferase
MSEKPMSASSSNWMVVAYSRVRSLIGVVASLAFTGICSTLVIVFSFLGKYEVATAVIHYWARFCLWVFGIKIDFRGEENLPQAGGGIVIFNHQSLFDIPVIISTTDKNIRFGAKIELFKIPFFGPAMRAIGTLPIARENRNQVMQIYKEAEKRFAMNTLFVLAPEGTRQKEPQIGKFKKGPFIFAIDAGVPLIPVVLKGTHAVLPKKSATVNIGRLSRTIHVEYLPPIPTQGLTHDDLVRVQEIARNAMVASYESLPADS